MPRASHAFGSAEESFRETISPSGNNDPLTMAMPQFLKMAMLCALTFWNG